MALMLFANAIKKGEAIKVFNKGDMQRYFTYIDDIVEGGVCCIMALPKATPKAEVFNIGNSQPMDLMEFISTMEECMGQEVKKNFMPMQAGDVKLTWADTKKLENIVDYKPATLLKVGVQHFVEWYESVWALNKIL